MSNGALGIKEMFSRSKTWERARRNYIDTNKLKNYLVKTYMLSGFAHYLKMKLCANCVVVFFCTSCHL